MTLLEVAKHALQAMEDAMYRADTHEFYDAKESLRYAIEQAEQQEPVAWNWMQDGQPYSPAYYGPPPDDDVVRIGLANGRSVRLLYTAPTPQPEQEPVAWIQKTAVDWLTTTSSNAYIITTVMKNTDDEAYVPLYTAPTPRKPLTDGEIVDIYKKWDVTPGVSMADFARAIERHHGITGEQHE